MNEMKTKKSQHKSHFCIFCHREVSRMYMHLNRTHKNEEKVKSIHLIQDKAERLWAWKRLTQEGDCYYNNTSKDHLGEKRIVKKLNVPSKRKKYYECPRCYGRIRITTRRKHNKKCRYNFESACVDSEEPKKDFSSGLPEELINRIRKSLYLNNFIARINEEKGRTHHAKLRTMARDLIKLEETLQNQSKESMDLVRYFTGKHVDAFLSSIKLLSGQSKEDNNIIFTLPSRAIRLCRCITQLGEYLKVYYSKQDMDVDVLNVTKFLNIFISESDKIIKKPALRSIKLKKLKKPVILPKTSDVLKLINKLKEETPRLENELKSKKNARCWRLLAENVLCRLTIFNRRRGGAVEKLTVQDFLTQPDKDVTEESQHEIADDEKQFLQNTRIIEVLHKCDNLVPIFVTKDIEKTMDVLMEHRQYADVDKDNKFFFAAGKNSNNPISGVKVMERYRKMFPKAIQELFTATNIRKHGATTAQVLELTPRDTEEWASHMGHTVDVHKRYYRIKEETNAILKTGRILTALDSGTIKFYKGRKIEDISLSSTPGAPGTSTSVTANELLTATPLTHKSGRAKPRQLEF